MHHALFRSRRDGRYCRASLTRVRLTSVRANPWKVCVMLALIYGNLRHSRASRAGAASTTPSPMPPAARSKRGGHTVLFHDLYEEGFDPLLPAAELDDEGGSGLRAGALLRGVAAVRGIGHRSSQLVGPAAGGDEGMDRPRLPPRRGLQIRGGRRRRGRAGGPAAGARRRSSSTPPTLRRSARLEVFGDPLDNLWKKCILEFCGVKNVVRETFSVVITSTPEQRAAWLRRVEEIVGASFR